MWEKLKQLLKSKAQKQAERRLAAIDQILQRYDDRPGVYKRIDENRELLVALQTQSPELLAESPWLRWWIANNDGFFLALEACVAADYKELVRWRINVRPWPAVGTNGYRPAPSAFLGNRTDVYRTQESP